MAIRFAHIQEAKTVGMCAIAGSPVSVVLKAGTYADKEVFRAYINPGFPGTIEFLTAHLRFQVTGTAVANTLSGEWQMRARGETTWTQLSVIPNVALDATAQSNETSIFYDAVAATNTSPWELRLIISTTAATMLTFTFTYGDSGNPMATLTVGESV